MGVLLYNWFGYRALYYYLQARADRQMESRLDRHQYNEADLIEIKIALHSPYIGPTTRFERCDGELDFNGRHYAYVKRRVQNDSLVLLCVAHSAPGKIREAGNNYFKMVNDLSRARQQGKETASFFKTLLTEYQPAQHHWTFSPPAQDPPVPSRRSTLTLSSFSLRTPEQPPESILL